MTIYQHANIGSRYGRRTIETQQSDGYFPASEPDQWGSVWMARRCPDCDCKTIEECKTLNELGRMSLGLYPNSSELYLEAACLIESAHKFILPDNGFLFDYATAAMVDGFSIPFDTCVFEYGIAGETGEDPPLPKPAFGRQRMAVSRVVTLCRRYRRGSDDVVAVMPVFASDQGEWHLALFSAELYLNDFCAVDVPKVGGDYRFLQDGVGIMGCSFLVSGDRSMEILGVDDTQDYKWLNERARKGIGRRGRRKREPFWGVVQEVFCLGSTCSCMLARACGLDPDSGEDVKP